MAAKPWAADPPGEDDKTVLRPPWVDDAGAPAMAGLPPNVRFPLLVAAPLDPTSDPFPRTKLAAIAVIGTTPVATLSGGLTPERLWRTDPADSTAADNL